MNTTESVNDGSPILDSYRNKSGIDIKSIEEDLNISPEKQDVLFRKCACNSSWCPSCGLPKLMSRMLDLFRHWDFRQVMQRTGLKMLVLPSRLLLISITQTRLKIISIQLSGMNTLRM